MGTAEPVIYITLYKCVCVSS